MKRFFTLLLCAILLLGCTACDSDNTSYPDKDNNKDNKNNNAVTETSSFEVTEDMITYFFVNTVRQEVDSNYYLTMMGFDPSQSMSAQVYDTSTYATYYEYFLNRTASAIQNYLIFTEAGKSEDFECNIDALVDDHMDEFKAAAEKLNMTLDDYIVSYYGDNVSEADIREALSLQLYANAYLNMQENTVKNSLTDSDYEAYKAENENELKKVDYLSFTIAPDAANDATEEEETEAKVNAENDANALNTEAAKGEEAFKTWVTTYLTEKNETKETPSDEETLAEEIENVLKTHTASYEEDDGFSSWAFSEERSAGDTRLYLHSEDSYTVYLITEPSYLPEYETKNVHHILLTEATYGSDDAANKKAGEILTEYKKGEQTAVVFDKLADKYTEDSNNFYENVLKGAMVDEFNDWIYDDARKAGDTDVVKTEYGYHVMYFEGDGLSVWKAQARSELTNEKLTELCEEIIEKYEDQVTFDTTLLYQLPDTLPQGKQD